MWKVAALCIKRGGLSRLLLAPSEVPLPGGVCGGRFDIREVRTVFPYGFVHAATRLRVRIQHDSAELRARKVVTVVCSMVRPRPGHNAGSARVSRRLCARGPRITDDNAMPNPSRRQDSPHYLIEYSTSTAANPYE